MDKEMSRSSAKKIFDVAMASELEEVDLENIGVEELRAALRLLVTAFVSHFFLSSFRLVCRFSAREAVCLVSPWDVTSSLSYYQWWTYIAAITACGRGVDYVPLSHSCNKLSIEVYIS